MHYLTKLFLDAAALRKENIRDDYSIHRLVYSLFPLEQERSRFLYADKGSVRGGRLLLVLSEKEPNVPEYVTSATTIISENFFRFYDYRFEIDLNQVKKGKESGKRRAVTGQLDLLNWFIAHSEKWGFQADARSLEVSVKPVRQFSKDGTVCTFNHAFFRGRLHVTDQKKFRESFFAGLGHGKAFGFGLLQLHPISNATSIN